MLDIQQKYQLMKSGRGLKFRILSTRGADRKLEAHIARETTAAFYHSPLSLQPTSYVEQNNQEEMGRIEHILLQEGLYSSNLLLAPTCW